MNRSSFNSEQFSPFGQLFGLAVVGKYNCVSAISGLLLSRCPAAVLRFVSSIYVIALKSHCGRALAHVGQEVLKRHPSFANLDSPSAVVAVVAVVIVQASIFHGLPSAISSRDFSGPAVAVVNRVGASHFRLIAATRLGVSALERTGVTQRLSSAIASAQPPGESSWRWRANRQHKPSAKSLPAKIVNPFPRQAAARFDTATSEGNAPRLIDVSAFAFQRPPNAWPIVAWRSGNDRTVMKRLSKMVHSFHKHRPFIKPAV